MPFPQNTPVSISHHVPSVRFVIATGQNICLVHTCTHRGMNARELTLDLKQFSDRNKDLFLTHLPDLSNYYYAMHTGNKVFK